MPATNLDSVTKDLRFGLRMLRKNPAFTIISILALALGIGFSTTVFSIFYNGVLHPFAYRDANRLTIIGITDTAQNNGFRDMFRLSEISTVRKQARSFEDVVAYGGWETTFPNHGVPEPIHICVTTPNVISFWGMQPVLGRGITEQDAESGVSPVAFLGYDFWQKTYHGDKSVIGSTIVVNGQARTIIGVMPHRFALYGADFYMPINWNRPEPANYQEAADKNDPWYFFANALINPHTSVDTAAADLQVIAKQLATIYPKEYPDHFKMTVRPFNEALVQDFPKTLALLSGAVLLLLLISSSNVASLLLTHHTARSREIALRTALGWSPAWPCQVKRTSASIFPSSDSLSLYRCSPPSSSDFLPRFSLPNAIFALTCNPVASTPMWRTAVPDCARFSSSLRSRSPYSSSFSLV
jgi:putative ABC transport system permease protein